MAQLLTVSASPHIRTSADIYRAMRLVIIALLPALFGAIYYFGLRALMLVLISVASAIVFDVLGQKIFGRKINIADGSAVITGILLAYNLPAGAPWWIVIVGSVFAILVVKQFFGGLGYNFLNPALAGRAFLMASWPNLMTSSWLAPKSGTISGLDAITEATPLGILKHGSTNLVAQLNSSDSIANLFWGRVGGCIGETSAFLLIGGGLLLLILGVIDYRIVLGYLGTVIVLAVVLPARASIPFHLFSGGLMLGVFFMATDWVTSPVTKLGRLLFGIGCGALTMVIRLWGGYPEGVSYAILLMNLFTPLIDRYTRGPRFGEVRSIIKSKPIQTFLLLLGTFSSIQFLHIFNNFFKV